MGQLHTLKKRRMMKMNFNHPVAFFLLLTIPLFQIFRFLKVFERPSYKLTVADWNGRRFEWKNTATTFMRLLSKVLFVFSYILFIIVLADPVGIHSQKEYTSRGAEIVFVVDESPSMAALDIASDTRLSAAKKAITYLVSENTGASYGLVACGLEAALLVPPTMDQNSFVEQLDRLAIGELGDGSAIGTGLATAVYHLISSQSPSKMIVLLTDGENNAGSIHPLTAADLAHENNIRVFVAGIGTKGTVNVKYSDPKTGKVYSGYLESDFDDSSLRAIALAGNGEYFTIETLESLKAALQMVNEKSSTFQTYQIKQTRENYYQSILAIVLFLFALTWLIRRVFMKEII
jgi:Ca-activated chloride channel family protein